ncbi:hypothetical protein AC249_AIPGENE6624, partial [Exaiptasia diaphana]
SSISDDCTLYFAGLAWDYYDGAQNQETLSADFKKTAVKTLPSIMEASTNKLFHVVPGFLMQDLHNDYKYRSIKESLSITFTAKG